MHQVSGKYVVPVVPEFTGRLLVRPEEGAEILGLTRTRIYALIASGRLRSVKVGRSRRIPMEDIERFVAEEVEAQCA